MQYYLSIPLSSDINWHEEIRANLTQLATSQHQPHTAVLTNAGHKHEVNTRYIIYIHHHQYHAAMIIIKCRIHFFKATTMIFVCEATYIS